MTMCKKVLAIGISVLVLSFKVETAGGKAVPKEHKTVSGRMHKRCKVHVFQEGLAEIGYRAFFKCKWLEKVIFPTTLKHIGDMAFYGTSLQEVNIPEGITKIGVACFGLCKKLKKVIFPPTLTKIEAAAFSNTGLQDLTLPEGITEIGYHAFRDTNIKKLTLPGNISNIGGVYFEKKFNRGKPYEYDEANNADPVKNFITYMLFGKKDITELTLPDGATNSDFHGKLNKIILPTSLVTFDYSSVEKNALKEVVFTIENSRLQKIGRYAFSNTGVKEFVIPPTVTNLGGLQFDSPFNNGKPYKYTQKNKDSLKPLIDIMLFGKTNGINKIPENVIGLDKGGLDAFFCSYAGSNRLKKVILPAKLKRIGGFVFENTFNNNKPYGYVRSIKKKDNFRRFIDLALCYGDYKITKITIPEGVIAIEDHALEGHRYLREVTFPSTLRKIGKNLFAHSGIKKVIVPGNVASLVLPVIPKGVEIEYRKR